MGTPVTSGSTIAAIAPRPIMVNNQAVVRLQAVPARANGPGTVTVNFPPTSQASTSVPAIRSYQKRAPAIAVRMTAPIGNGPATSSVSQVPPVFCAVSSRFKLLRVVFCARLDRD